MAIIAYANLSENCSQRSILQKSIVGSVNGSARNKRQTE